MKALALITVPLLVAYALTLRWVWDSWFLADSYYSHGPLVVGVFALVVWLWRDRWRVLPATVDARAWALLGPGLLVHLAGAALTIDSLSAASLVLVVPGAAWFALGAARVRALAPLWPLVAFAIPLPMFVTSVLVVELKEFAVQAGLGLANLFGLDAVRAGAVLRVPSQAEPLLVADPCSGLRSLVALTTLGYCVAFLMGAQRGIRRWVLLAVSVPVALGSNIVRIAALCWVAELAGVAAAGGAGHEVVNAFVWLVAIGALLGLDALLSRGRDEVPSAPPAAPLAVDPSSVSFGRLRLASLVLVWLLAPFLLWLCAYRPFTSSAGLAEQLPTAPSGFALEHRIEMTPRMFELLGTDDAVWWVYGDREAGGEPVRVVCVFHAENWKSVHPPYICIRGSDMDVVEDEVVPVDLLGESRPIGRILSVERRGAKRRYLGYYAFVAPGLVTGSYLSFFLHHAPRALVRSSQNGFLLRVEAFVDGPGSRGDLDATAGKLRRFLEGILPPARDLLVR